MTMHFGRAVSAHAVSVWAILAMTSLGLAACDNGPSAVQTRDRTVKADVVTLTAATGAGVADVATPEVAARPVLTANRRETVDAKITRLYERNGAAFGARSPEDYLARIKTFTETPPSGVDTVKRPNGDTLFYQASTNTFAVVSRDGTPRTMFKPDDGATYWAEQKSRAPTFGQSRNSQN
ncbi:S-type pyocin family protein [Brevundimonas sp.]|jgi:pyocin large subunit-like protein|uniref:S-type pyocin family protein n=1 Tax=Brevundimonas sp. TaxID=1871086 RepID=UPI003782F9C3